MELEGRAARRPIPRQMDASDWNVDLDVRSGVSSSISAFQRDRSGLDARASSAADAGRRLSSGDELRSDVRNMMRPVNRYDSAGTTTNTREDTTTASSLRRVGESGGRAAMSLYTRMSDSVMEREPSSQRMQPRSNPDSRRLEDPLRQLSLYRDVDEMGARFSAIGSVRGPVRRREDAAPAAEDEVERRSLLESRPTPVEYSPPREQYRQATPPSTVRSDASTALTSSPFTPSTTDTPPSLARSMLSPPYTPSGEETSTRHSSPELTPSFPNHRATRESSPDSRTESSIVGGEQEPSSMRLGSSGPRPSPPAHDRSTSPTATLIAAHASTSISPRHQREQLYDFRRDMRQVFARVDEMVDSHRDMFKCDPFSGMPEFNAVIARETASFTSETFELLKTLRERFEAMTTARPRAASSSSDSDPETPPRRTRRVDTNDSRRSSETRFDVSSISTGRSPPSTVDNQWSAVESSVSCESPTASSQRGVEILHRAAVRPRWEPTLSTLSNDDDNSSSTSSTPESYACSSSLLSELPTLSRPGTASSSTVTANRANVFEDFDKRMEEIRASLNAMSRDKPLAPPSPRSVSTRLSNASLKSCGTSDHDHDDNDPDEAHGENNARVGNRVALPWHQPHDVPPATSSSGATTRHDREARLRQLLRELQTTGEHLDAGGDGSRA